MHMSSFLHNKLAFRLMPLIVTAFAGILYCLLLVEHAKLNEPLLQACRQGNYPVVKRLLQQGANPNAHLSVGFIRQMDEWLDGPVDGQEPLDTTALVEAAAQGHNHIVRLLIANGANVHTLCRYEAPTAECYDPRRYTALKWARNGNHLDTVRVLEQAGATE